MARTTIDGYFSPKAPKRCRPSASAEDVAGNGGVDVALGVGSDRLREAKVRARRLASHARDLWSEKESEGRVPLLGDMLLEEGWKRSLDPAMSSSSFKRLEAFVEKEWKGNKPIYPPAPCVFHAFHSCTLGEVKVVLLGQDPYHGPGQAMGLSFSVPKGQRVPPSLQNIYKEIQEDLGIARGTHGDLTRWAQQGVFMLNAVMTVRSGEANSHAKQGWEEFTDAAIRIISEERTGVVFLLWGRHAQAKERLIDAKRHHVLKAAHPSGLSAHRGFFGCKHFSKTNAILRSTGEAEIDWSVA